jgi:hypothetical protein
MRHRTWRIPKSPRNGFHTTFPMHDVPPRDRYALAFHRTLWNVFFVLKKPRSEHVSDEAMHGGLGEVPRGS